MLAVTQAEASSTRFSRITADGKIVWRTEFIGPPPSRRTEQLIDAKPPEYTDPKPFETREPQAFLVERKPEQRSHHIFIMWINFRSSSPATASWAGIRSARSPFILPAPIRDMDRSFPAKTDWPILLFEHPPTRQARSICLRRVGECAKASVGISSRDICRSALKPAWCQGSRTRLMSGWKLRTV
jgi:hypothetical protein